MSKNVFGKDLYLSVSISVKSTLPDPTSVRIHFYFGCELQFGLFWSMSYATTQLATAT